MVCAQFLYRLCLNLGVSFGFYTVLKEMISWVDFNDKIIIIYQSFCL